jgi:hypothetical protein
VLGSARKCSEVLSGAFPEKTKSTLVFYAVPSPQTTSDKNGHPQLTHNGDAKHVKVGAPDVYYVPGVVGQALCAKDRSANITPNLDRYHACPTPPGLLVL